LTADEVDLLARLVQAEAGNQSLEGKIAVANVVINRIDSSYFPSTITGIIFDTNSGVQFTTAYNGAIYNTPSQECYVAVNLALEGENVAQGCLFFASTTDCWANRNRPLVMVIGDHYFYA
jgi:N-acetylmuramoyl-L-alanine amidase